MSLEGGHSAALCVWICIGTPTIRATKHTRSKRVCEEKSSGNVFAVLGLPHPEQELLESRLMLLPPTPGKTADRVSYPFSICRTIVWPALADVGVMDAKTAGAKTFAVASPSIPGVCILVAVIVMFFGFDTVVGAVYNPLLLIVPAVLFPPTAPFTDQVTAELQAPVPATCAVNNWVCPVKT